MPFEEINPASVVREFLVISGMDVSDMRESSTNYVCGPYFFVRLPSNDLARVDALMNRPAVRISPASSLKIPVKHFRRNEAYWMDHDEHMDFELIKPGSLERILEFLNP